MQLKLFGLLALNLFLLSPLQAMLQELNFGAYLGLPAFLLPLNQEDNTNLARVLTNHIHTGHHSSMVWLSASFPAAYYGSQAVLGTFLFLAIQ